MTTSAGVSGLNIVPVPSGDLAAVDDVVAGDRALDDADALGLPGTGDATARPGVHRAAPGALRDLGIAEVIGVVLDAPVGALTLAVVVAGAGEAHREAHALVLERQIALASRQLPAA